MSLPSTLQARRFESVVEYGGPNVHARKGFPTSMPFRVSTHNYDPDAQNRHAELFYLQKQIQSQTPMVIVLEDGEKIEGYIEWYDRNALKVRGRSRMLVYKSAIKYMHKLGETGQ
jgi:sRNA-binding regulator protein Hfq